MLNLKVIQVLMKDLAAGILVGGASKRMGFPKYQLDFPDGTGLLETKIAKLSSSVAEILVAAAPDSSLPKISYPIKILRDQESYQGPLEGLCTLLKETAQPYLFLTACDMPFLLKEMVSFLFQRSIETQQVVVPMTKEGPIYLFSVFPTCFKELIFDLRKQEFSLKSLKQILEIHWVSQAEWEKIDPKGSCWQNLNYPAEYQKFLAENKPKI